MYITIVARYQQIAYQIRSFSEEISQHESLDQEDVESYNLIAADCGVAQAVVCIMVGVSRLNKVQSADQVFVTLIFGVVLVYLYLQVSSSSLLLPQCQTCPFPSTDQADQEIEGSFICI